MSTITHSTSIGGKSFSQQRSVAAEGEIARQKDLPAAKAATLTTRTDDDTGVITVAAGVGAQFSVGERVDVYWDVGGIKGHRRGMLVSSIAVDAITVGTAVGDVGAGNIFPAAASVVQLAKSVLAEFRVDGDDVAVLAFASDARAIIVLTEADGLEDHFVHLPEVGAAVVWDKNDGTVNPIATKVIARAYMSHNDTASTKAVKVGVAYN